MRQSPLLFILLFNLALSAQGNFKVTMQNGDPVCVNDIGTESSIRIHKTLLQKAIAAHDDMHQLNALLYLFEDYYRRQDFVTLTKYLLMAEKLAESSQKPAWKGQVLLFRARLTAVISNRENAIKELQKAVQLCAAANDSLCMGEAYEQLGAQNRLLKNLKESHHYFELAEPLIKKHSRGRELSRWYNNYGSLFSNENEDETAVSYADSAIAIAVRDKNLYNEMNHRHNLAATYIDMKEYEKADAIFKQCEPINRSHKWQYNLMFNYFGQSENYSRQHLYQPAFEYLDKYYFLKDSLSGANVTSKIADLELKHANDVSRIEILKSQRQAENYIWLTFSMLTAILLGLWFWRRQNIRNKKEVAENQKNLTALTNLMIEKNMAILEFEEKLAENETNTNDTFSETATQENTTEEETALYRQRILTNNDWSSFKYNFEKVYPGYIKKVRDQYPTITEAEERLFLCLKLNLKTRENAAMLGISFDSIKKNRQRLRKRLELGEEQDLNAFVRAF